MIKRNFYNFPILLVIFFTFILPCYSQLIPDGIQQGTILKSPHPSRPLWLECVSDGQAEDRNYSIIIPASSESARAHIGYLSTRFFSEKPHLAIEKLSISALYQRQNYGLQALETLFYAYQQKPHFPLQEYVAFVSLNDPAVMAVVNKLGARPDFLVSGMMHGALRLLGRSAPNPYLFVHLPRSVAEKRIMDFKSKSTNVTVYGRILTLAVQHLHWLKK